MEKVKRHNRYSFRLPNANGEGKSKMPTSISLKNSVSALFLLKVRHNGEKPNSVILTFINENIHDWDGENPRGLSDFITQRMIERIIQEEYPKKDSTKYQKILSELQE